MTDPVVTEPPAVPAEAPDAPVVAKTEDAPLGAPGLAALQAERDARKAAEEELKALKDRDKTEAEKTAERLANAEKRASELEAIAARAEVAADKGIPTTLLAGPASNSAADLAKFADALIAYRGERGSNPLQLRNEGKSPTAQSNTDLRGFAKQLFGNAD